MTEKLEFYRCDICGNIVQVLYNGEGQLVCCGKFMEKLQAKDNDVIAEKHVPVFIKNDENKDLVQVGSELHPMSKEHYITFIETVSNDKKRVEIEFLYPDETPQMITNSDVAEAYEYCNIHGLWKNIK